MPEKPERTLDDMIVHLDNPHQDAAEARALAILEQAELNEAVRVVESLQEEVRTMHVSNRFKRDVKPSESPYAAMKGELLNPMYKNLTEDEYKRRSLLDKLEVIKSNIHKQVRNVHEVVLEIEATKMDDPSPPDNPLA